MNKHIELVKKWLDDPASVSQDELEANSDAANAAYYDAYADAAYTAAYTVAYDAAYAARFYAAADAAAAAAAYTAADAAAYYVKKYEELTEGE